MTLPKPEAGLVIRYSYLWLREHREGREEGVKDRPCAIVLATKDHEGDTQVLVLPVTHSKPQNVAEALELPQLLKSTSDSMPTDPGSFCLKAICSIGPDPTCAASVIAVTAP